MVEHVEETIRQRLAEVRETLEGLMLPETFGSRLAHYRGRAGILQRDLARQIGMDPAYLNRIERGRIKPPKLDRVLMMARVLHLPPAHILGLVELAGYQPELLLQV